MEFGIFIKKIVVKDKMDNKERLKIIEKSSKQVGPGVFYSTIVVITSFLPVFLLVYHLVPHAYKNAIILLASIYFYSWGGPKFMFVILGTTFLDFFLVNAMHNQKTQKAKLKK